jgi:hypothetical protein
MTADPVDLPEILQATHASEHRLFYGKLVKKDLIRPDTPAARGTRRVSRARGRLPGLGRDQRLGLADRACAGGRRVF